MTMRYSKPPSQRQLKVAEEIKKSVSYILSTDQLFHPALENAIISITEVRISADLKAATLFFTNINGDKEGIIEVMNGFTPEIRRLVAKSVKLRYTPNLRFVYDDNIDNAIRLDGILQEDKR